MDFTKEQYQTLLFLFNCVLSHAEAGIIPRPMFGICNNAFYFQEINKELTDTPSVNTYDAVAELSEGWDKHSGVRHYPVPGFTGTVPYWRGSQLALRISLLEYMIAKIEARLKDMED